jgi:hypothetical protein
MSRIFILAFVLFATLFAVNAAPFALEKRDTKFSLCLDSLPDVVVPLRIILTPEVVVAGGIETFDIIGTMKKDIVDGDFIIITFTDNKAEQPILGKVTVDICNPGFECPIKAGTQFFTTQQVIAPANLPSKYFINVGIVHPLPPSDADTIACSFGIVDRHRR